MTPNPKRIFDFEEFIEITQDAYAKSEKSFTWRELESFIDSEMRRYANEKVREFAEKMKGNKIKLPLTESDYFANKIISFFQESIDLELAKLEKVIFEEVQT